MGCQTDLIWILILVGAPVILVLEAVRCLYLDRGWRRNLLAAALGLLAGGGALYFLGDRVLAAFALAWRAWVGSLLLGLAVPLSVLAAVLTVCSMIHRKRRPFLAEALLVEGSALVFLFLAVVFGIFLWLSTLCPERVVTWEGRTLVEEDGGSLWRYDHGYYDYHGPLVRGREPLVLVPEAGEADVLDTPVL